MSAYPVSQCIKKDWSLLFIEDLHFSSESVNNGQRIISIDTFGMHHFGIYSGAQAGKYAITHRFSHCLATHAVKVVHYIEYEWQSSPVFTIPESFILVHRGKANTLPDRTTGSGCITYIADYYAFLPVYLFIKRCTYRNIT